MLPRFLPAVALALACTSAPPSPPPLPAPIRLNPAAAINLTFTLRSGGTACGAVAVGPHQLATAGHCVPFAEAKYASREEPEDWLTGIVVERNIPGDAAIVMTLEPLDKWASLATVKRGDNVYSIHHCGSPYRFEAGKVEGEPRIERLDWVEADVVVCPGASGGGLWDTSNNLAGIVSWFRGSSSYFVPARELDALIR